MDGSMIDISMDGGGQESVVMSFDFVVVFESELYLFPRLILILVGLGREI